MKAAKTGALKTLADKFIAVAKITALGGAVSLAASPGAIAGSVAWGDFLSKPFAGANKFESEHKNYLRYSAISGPIVYLDQVRDDQEEGYALTSELQLLGEMRRTVWDYTEKDSALQVGQTTLDQLKKHGFDLLYQCSGQDCGDTAGWSLYMSSRIDGTADQQHYLLARGPLDRGHDWYVAVYTNDIGGIPRSVIDVVKGHPVAETTQNAVSVIDNKQPDNKAMPLVFFPFNSDRLTIATDQAIRSIAQYLKKNEKAQIQIVGHTDNTGEEAHNNQLSERRAMAVYQRLITHYGISEDRLKLYGAGEFGPIITNDRADRRKVNRRVEIQQLEDVVGNQQPSDSDVSSN